MKKHGQKAENKEPTADQRIEFYQHEVGWANRLILGDSLLVMNSLLVKEGMAGKVQMIYIDPPYGIKYASNFQPRLDRRDVKDQDLDLTREPEQIKAYRDTWKLGIHSYLTYLRDRLLLARDLLTESGSIFVQINDENLHLVRSLLDEVFGRENFVAVVAFLTTTGRGARYIDVVYDCLLWYGKDVASLKYRQLFLKRTHEMVDERYVHVELTNGEARRLAKDELEGISPVPSGERFRLSGLTSQGATTGETSAPFVYNGREYRPSSNRHWSTTLDGLRRLVSAERLTTEGKALVYKRYHRDFPIVPLHNVWTDTGGGALVTQKLYAVQTAEKVIERCILMTTDPGDLVFDPTCVRKGTRVWTPTPTLPVDGEGAFVPPSTGGPQGGITPIENLHPGDLILGLDGKPHRVLHLLSKPYRGAMIGIRHALSPNPLWLTADHRVLCKMRPRTLGGHRDWSASPPGHLDRRRQLRREASPAEQELWSALRNKQLGVKFRRQHPIGPYIADFYSREAHLVVEVDGSTHFDPEAMKYDAQRNDYMRALGLDVLRFTTSEVLQNLEGVCLAIQNQCRIRTQSLEGAKWVQAGTLQSGDLVFFGHERQAVPIESVENVLTEEEVYDLEVESAHSFLTEVCAVHNCGSGTTASCAEKWGRRWITCDTSRVALAIARQRLMTAKYDYYELADPERGPAGGFIYETVPHITLESIAKNPEIDTIAAKYQPQIDAALAELNRALSKDWKEWGVPRELPPTQPPPWAGEEQQTPSLSAGRAGEEQQTPSLSAGRAGEEQQTPSLSAGRAGEEQQTPSLSAGRAGEGVKEAHEQFWSFKRKKRQEIDASIQRNAPQETLYDRPQVGRGVVRVSGPFTVEAIPVPTVEDPTQMPIPQFEEEEARARVSDRGGDYLTTMLNLLKQQGCVLFPGGRKMELQNLRLLNLGMLHAEGETPPPQPSPDIGGGSGRGLRVAVSFGPQHGPVTAFQVQEAIPTARMNAYNVLIFAGFSFDPEAQALIQKAPVAGLQMHFANIAPDVLVGDLLKTTRVSQIFTVFGQPDVALTPAPSPASGRGEKTYIVELRGVDIYDPLTGETQHAHGSDVAAWFLDTDYDGMTFHICQALFPGDADAWDKLQRALKASIDAEAFEQMRGTVSFPFQPGEHQRIAVKVIDFRGNEVVRVIKLDSEGYL